MSTVEEEILQENQIVDDMEVVIRYFACRICDIRFDSVEQITGHLQEEHQISSHQSDSLKEEMEEDNTTTALDNEDYIIIEERQMLSEIAQNPQLLQQLAATQENGQFVLQIVENEHEEEVTADQSEISLRKTPKKNKSEEPLTKTRSARKRKAVDKDYYPTAETRLRKNIKIERETPHVLHLSHEDHPIDSNEVNEETIGNFRSIEDNDESYPTEYTPTYKAKKGRVVSTPGDSVLRKFPCPFQGCNYVAKYRSNLWDHKKTHTGEKPYVCTWPSCSMKFSQTHQLKLHLRSHTGERPYVCDWPGCNSAFSQKPGLKSHMLTHTGEKPYKCDYPGCIWTFRLKGALTDHKRAIHENAKKHVCSWPGCNKRFLQHCHLKKHVMGHADIKPFSCDWPNCNYKAVTMAYVSNHRKTHTGEKNYECTYLNCNKRFVKSSHVNRHRARCHPDLFTNLSDELSEDEEEEGEILDEQSEAEQAAQAEQAFDYIPSRPI